MDPFPLGCSMNGHAYRPDQIGMIPMESTRIRTHDCQNPATWTAYPSVHPVLEGLRMLLPHRALKVSRDDSPSTPTVAAACSKSLSLSAALMEVYVDASQTTTSYTTCPTSDSILFLSRTVARPSSFGRTLHHTLTQHSGSQLPNMGQEIVEN